MILPWLAGDGALLRSRQFDMGNSGLDIGSAEENVLMAIKELLEQGGGPAATVK